jgi:alpha-L-rhamnosidase
LADWVSFEKYESAFLRDIQTPHLFALRLGFYDRIEAKKESITMLLENIDSHGGCLQTGFLGTSILMDTLTYHADRPDVAYSLPNPAQSVPNGNHNRLQCRE